MNNKLSYMFHSGSILASALELGISMIEEGTAVSDIDKEVEKFIRSNNAEPSFIGLDDYKHASCISVNNEIVHAVPSKRVLQKKDIVTLDVGVRYKNLCTDAARTVTVGVATGISKILIETVSKALDAGISEAVVGNNIGDISYSIQRVVEYAGFVSPLELGGHGIGTKPHMRPFLPNYGVRGSGPQLHVGQCIAIEPIVLAGKREVVFTNNAVYSADGALSSHREDTIYISDDNPIILTRMTLKGDYI